MKWRNFVYLALFVFIFPTVLLAANPAELQRQIDQVRQDREALVAEQKRLQVELEAINKETRSLGSAVMSLDSTKKKLAADINVTRSKIKSTDLTIQSLENQTTEKEKQIIIHRRAIADTIAILSQRDSSPLILGFLASANLSDIWRDGSQLIGLNGRLEDEINVLRETKQVLTEQRVEKEKVKENQESLQNQLAGQKSVVEESQKAKEQLLAQTKNKEAEYQRILAENLARQKQSEDDLYRLESELKIILDPSLLPDVRHGLLAWPLDKIFITNKFGKNAGNIRIYASGFHNGVDFRASMGTPVRSISDGVVEGTGNTDEQRGCYSYGRWILIRHNNGLTSIYAHLSSSLVRKGQTIKARDIIGYSGGQPGVNGSGYSTGPHLHLGLFATQGVEIRQFVTSRGCKKVSVPIAKGTNAYLDPLAYLPSI